MRSVWFHCAPVGALAVLAATASAGLSSVPADGLAPGSIEESFVAGRRVVGIDYGQRLAAGDAVCQDPGAAWAAMTPINFALAYTASDRRLTWTVGGVSQDVAIAGSGLPAGFSLGYRSLADAGFVANTLSLNLSYVDADGVFDLGSFSATGANRDSDAFYFTHPDTDFTISGDATWLLNSFVNPAPPLGDAVSFELRGYSGTVEPVPEPTTFAILGLGALAGLRRRRR